MLNSNSDSMNHCKDAGEQMEEQLSVDLAGQGRSCRWCSGFSRLFLGVDAKICKETPQKQTPYLKGCWYTANRWHPLIAMLSITVVISLCIILYNVYIDIYIYICLHMRNVLYKCSDLFDDLGFPWQWLLVEMPENILSCLNPGPL